MYEIGETPGAGTYRCCRCNEWEVTLDHAELPLPPCRTCCVDDGVRFAPVLRDRRPRPERRARGRRRTPPIVLP